METPISPKVTTAAAAGAITTILVWIASYFGGVEIPPPVGAALTLIIMSGAAWWKRDRLRDAGQAAVEASPATFVADIPEVMANKPTP